MSETELLEKVQAITNLIDFARFDKMPIAYLSGKVSGLYPPDVTKKFSEDTEILRAKGLFVFNPTEWLSDDCDWKIAMRLCLAILPLCETLYMQPDWLDSDGAVWEISTAKRLGLNLERVYL